jgi:hypothetical protein
MEFATGQGVFLGNDAVVGTRDPGSCTFTAEIGGLVTITGVVASSGTEITGGFVYHPTSTSLYTGTWQIGRVIGSNAGSGPALSSDPNDNGVSPTTPLVSAVSTPNPGPITIDQALLTGGALRGFSILDTVVRITAPAGSAAAPLALTFELDSSVTRGLAPSAVTVYRNGDAVPDCIDAVPPILPDPCVSVRETLTAPEDGIRFTVLTSAASTWMFGTPQVAPAGFRVKTTALPGAQLGKAYSKRLDAVGGVPPFKWKRVGKLPKGLKLFARDGVISGTPTKKKGTFSFTVQVQYKVKVKKQNPIIQRTTKQLSITVT